MGLLSEKNPLGNTLEGFSKTGEVCLSWLQAMCVGESEDKQKLHKVKGTVTASCFRNVR